MAKLLTVEAVPGLAKADANDPLFRAWLERLARTTEQQSRLLRSVPFGTVSPQAPASDLVVNIDNASTTVAISWATLWVSDADGNPEVLGSASMVASLVRSLDTGAALFSPSTWYYVFIIWNGTTSRALISSSITSPTMPDGYTHKGLVGAVFSTAGSVVHGTYIQGNRAAINQIEVLTAGSSTTGALVSCGVAAPPSARYVSGWATVDDTAGNLRLVVLSLEGSRGITRVQDNEAIVSAVSNHFRVPCFLNNGAATITYNVALATNRAFIDVTGWEW